MGIYKSVRQTSTKPKQSFIIQNLEARNTLILQGEALKRFS